MKVLEWLLLPRTLGPRLHFPKPCAKVYCDHERLKKGALLDILRPCRYLAYFLEF